jgi:4-hydroxy-4-methyl-2-oxoglutarate aldolase
MRFISYLFLFLSSTILYIKLKNQFFLQSFIHMLNIIAKRPLIPEKLLKAMAPQATATIHEVMGQKGDMDPGIKPLAKGMRLCGRALTVQCPPGDNLMLIKAVSLLKAFDVLVMTSTASATVGSFGEVLAVECQARCASGLVTSGAVRDSSALISLGLPVFSSGLCIHGTSKATLGTINHPISCGGVLVYPGDLILGDDDGLVVIPESQAEDILQAALIREEKETKVKEKLRNGHSLFELYGYQAIIDRLGCLEEYGE